MTTGDNCPGHRGQLSPRAEGDEGQDTLSLKGVPCPLPQSQMSIDFDNPGLDWREADVLAIFGPWDAPGKADGAQADHAAPGARAGRLAGRTRVGGSEPCSK